MNSLKSNNSDHPIITVVVPTFNRSQYLGRCIRSLIRQKLGRELYEILVVDDGSTDNTSAILQVFGDWISVLRNPENMGLPHSLNVAAQKARGEYLVRVDSDDYVNENFLSMLSLFLEDHNDVQAVECDYLLVDDDEKILSRESALISPIGCAIMFSVASLKKAGMYNPDFLMLEEKEFRQRFSAMFTIQHLPLALYRYRQHSTNMTKDRSLLAKFTHLLENQTQNS